MTQPVVFISYSHKDEKEKNRLLAHLGVLQRVDLIGLWSDDRISAGADWKQEISQAMAQAKVAILLISTNFLTSDFILDEEVPTLLQRRKSEGLTIFPVIAKACAWQEVAWLVEMKVRPRNGRPIWGANSRRVDEDLATIAKEVAAIVRTTSPPPTDRDNYDQPTLDPAILRSNYLNRLFEISGSLSLSGVTPKTATNEAEARLNLGSVYVAMLTYGLENGEITSSKQLDRPTHLPAITQLDQHR